MQNKFKNWSATTTKKIGVVFFLTFQLLICQSSVAATYKLTCFRHKELETCPSDEKHLCSVDKDGTMSGCVFASACIEGDGKDELTCDKDPTATQHNCCCEADYCNNIRNSKVRDIYCKAFPMEICNAYSDHLVCLDGNGMEESCRLDQPVCQSKREGSTLTPVGCVASEECQVDDDEGFEVTCHPEKCCCEAKRKPCNGKEMTVNEVEMKIVSRGGGGGFPKPIVNSLSLSLVISIVNWIWIWPSIYLN